MARVARLGVVIDSSQAVSGAKAVDAALNTLSATAQRAQASVTAATAAVTRSGALQAAAAVQAAQATTTATVATQRQTAAVLENALASGTGTVSAKALAAAWVAEASAASAATAATVAHRTAVVSTTVATGAAAGATGLLGGAMAALGGPVTIALTAAMLGVQFIMGKVSEETGKAAEKAKDAEEAFKALTEAQLSNQLAQLEARRVALSSQRASAEDQGNLFGVLKLDKELAAIDPQLQKYTSAIQTLRRETNQGTSSVGALATSLANAQAELRAFQEGGEANAKAYRLAATAWSASKDGVRTLEAALRDGDASAKQLMQTAREQVAIETTLTRLRKESTEVVKRQKVDIDKLREALEFRARAERAVERNDEFKDDVKGAISGLDARLKKEQDIGKEKARQYLAVAEQIAQLQFQVSLIGKTREEVEKLTDEELRRRAIAEGATAQQADEVVRLQRQLRNAKNETESWESALQGVVGLAQLLASAFGDAGREAAKIGNGLQSILGGVGASGRIKVGDKKIGLGTALSGGGGAEAFASGLSVVGQYAAGALALAEAFGLFDDAARKAREGQIAYTKALEEYAIVQRTSLEQAIKDDIAKANQTAQNAFAASGTTGSITFGSGDELQRQIEQLRQGPEAFRKLADELAKLLPKIRANEAALRAEAAVRLQAATEDLAVRRLIAAGQTEAAEAERLRLAQVREIAAAEKEFGKDSPYLDELKKVQAAETAAAEAARELAAAEKLLQQARQAQAFAADLRARGQTLSGDDRGAAITRLGISQAGELQAAEALLKAGTITQEMFDELARVLSGELAKAIEDLDKAAQDAAKAIEQEKQNKRDELAVRALIATGDEAGAARVRREIANRQELEGVTDETLRAEILRVQGLEALAIALAEAARLEQERAAQNDDINRRLIDAYRVLDPIKAAELEQIREQIEREELLRGAVDEATRARYEELFAIEDQAKAVKKLADEQRAAAEAAEKLANLTATVEEEYLRATGRGFDADVKALERRRDEKLEEARKAGASEETIRQIKAIFEAGMQTLIARTMGASGSPSLGGGVVGGDTEYTTRAVTRSINSIEAIRLIDLASSQLIVLRQIASNTAGGGGNGVRVQVTVQGGAYSGSPQDVGTGIAQTLVPLLDQAIGRRVGVLRILSGKDTL
jgi:hypothetical protein